MTNAKKPHVHAEAIKAWADGADSPSWFVGNQYRVKHEPVIVEKFHGILQNKLLQSVNHSTGYYSNPEFVTQGVLTNPTYIEYKLIAIVKTTFADGQPVNVELMK
jgi:hypothetical protein